MGIDFEELKDREYKECFELAEKIIKRGIKTITGNVPELGFVFDRLCLSPLDKEIKLSTDGDRLYFNPKRVVITRQKKGLSEIQFQLLHVALHILRGDIIGYRQSPHKELMGAIIDTEVTEALMGLRQNAQYDSSRQNRDYYRLKYDKTAAAQFIMDAREKYSCDEHSIWLKFVKSTNQMHQDLTDLLDNIFGKEITDQIMSGNISLLDEFKNRFGEGIRLSFDQLTIGNTSLSEKHEYALKKSETDYRKVIEKLLEEVCVEKESAEIFDRNLYCYGLDIYGDVPLVEAGEDEITEKSVRGKLAIAIDTSGSTQGKIVEKFLGEIGKLLTQIMENCVDKDFEVVVFECDCKIKKEEHFLNDDILKAFNGKRNITGGGGTDFIPVFERIRDLGKKNGSAFSALIYFSDGYGEFPKTNPIPEVPVIFVLPREESFGNSPVIPEYVRKCFFK